MSRGMQAVFVPFCLGAGFLVWMVAYGALLGVMYGDWVVLEDTVRSNPLLPIQQFWVYFDNRQLQLVAIGSAFPALLTTGWLAYLGFRSHINPLGDAAFQSVADLWWGGWFRRKGYILGRMGRNILRTNDERHHLVIGPTRSGKGAGYVIPNALMHDGSMIVTDLKGEIFEATAGYRKSRGHQVFRFSPGSETTHRYNPLDYIRKERGSRTTDIQNMAAIMVPEKAGSDNATWQALAQQILAGVIGYILESDFYKSRRNLGEVNSLFNSGVNMQELLKTIIAREPGLSKFTVESFNAFLALSDRAAASTLIDVQNALRPWKNERIVAATNVTDMDLRSMQWRPVSIYLAPNITDMTLLRPLLTLFVQQTLDLLTLDHEPKAKPVYFLLDEFRQLKKMDEIMIKLPYVASYNIKFAFIIQDLKNIDEIYGETSRHSLLGNCGYQLIMGANDQATAEYTSRALGKRTIRYETESRTIQYAGLHRRTRVQQLRDRDLMMPQEIRQMRKDKMILLVEGQPPVFCEKLTFFDTKPFASANTYAAANIPDVPTVEYLFHKPVPATTEAYRADEESERDEQAVGGGPPAGSAQAVQDTQDAQTEPPTSQAEKPDDSSGRTEPSDTKRTVNAVAPLRREFLPKRPPVDIDALMEQVRQEVAPKSAGFGSKVRRKIESEAVKPRTRKCALELLDATVPDPLPEDAKPGEDSDDATRRGAA